MSSFCPTEELLYGDTYCTVKEHFKWDVQEVSDAQKHYFNHLDLDDPPTLPYIVAIHLVLEDQS